MLTFPDTLENTTAGATECLNVQFLIDTLEESEMMRAGLKSIYLLITPHPIQVIPSTFKLSQYATSS